MRSKISKLVTSNKGLPRVIVSLVMIMALTIGMVPINTAYGAGPGPIVTSVTVPADGTYRVGDNLDFRVNFDKDVYVHAFPPQITISIGSDNKVANYASGSGGPSLLFRYTVGAGDIDTDGVSIGSSIDLNGGAIKDADENDADLTLNSIGNTDNVFVDGLVPSILSAVRSDNTHIILTLNEDCTNITKANNGGFTIKETGTPAITYAVAAIAQGVDASHIVLTLADMGISAKEGVTVFYTAGGNGTIEDASGDAMATNAVGLGVVAWDTTRPSITSGALFSNNSYIDVSFNEPVYGENDGATALTTAGLALTFAQNAGTATNAVISSIKKTDNDFEGSASALTGGETTVRVFLTITGTSSGTETIAIAPADGASVYDKAGNAELVTDTTGTKTLRDNASPIISSLSPADNAVDVNIDSNLIITFNENVIPNGVGFITIRKSDGSTIESIAVTSGQVTGSGTTTITINPTNDFVNATSYYVQISPTGLEDALGNRYSGIFDHSSWSFTTAASISNNANLSAITLSSGTLSPAFDASSIAYTASVTNGTSSMTVTPTSGDIGATVRVNTIAVTSGQASGAINLNVGSNTITIEVTAADGVTTKTYVVTVTRAAAVSPPTAPSVTPPAELQTKANILINGEAVEAGTRKETEASDGTTTTTLIVDEEIIKAKLEEKGVGAIVTIQVTSDSDTNRGQLNGQIIKDMENAEAIIQVKTGNVTYTVPAGQINIDSISQLLGEKINLKDIQVNVTIANPSEATMKLAQDTANANRYTLVVNPVEFDITCNYGGQTLEVSKFTGYVERILAIPDGIDPSMITTGIVLNEDGTFSHVPTTIVEIDGRYYVKINSLTNSTYSVIYNSKAFEDMIGHWAMADVNDMASRLIITGVDADTYNPDEDITRAEFATIIVRALGLMRSDAGQTVFQDVYPTDWYYEAVSIASTYGIIEGVGGNEFKPNDKITRQEAMVMLSRAMKLTEKIDMTVTPQDIADLLGEYQDSDMIASWAKEAAAICIDNDIIMGYNRNISATENITRAETATIVKRMLIKAELI